MVGQTLAAVIVVAAGGAASIATGTSQSGPETRVVPCPDMIGDPQFPYRSGGYRLVLGGSPCLRPTRAKSSMSQVGAGPTGASQVLLFAPAPRP
jgi:hypothetical protein